MSEYVVRFLAGGIVVSGFAMLGDVLRPKSFAGLFGAAPSVALATLAIALYRHGAAYAVQQSRAMMIRAIALSIYSVVVCQLLIRARFRAAAATLLSFVETNSASPLPMPMSRRGRRRSTGTSSPFTDRRGRCVPPKLS